MIEKKLTTYFHRLAPITPRAEFVLRSRAEVTRAPQELRTHSWAFRLREAVTSGSALALASFLLLVVLGGVSYVAKHNGPVANSALNDASLAREAAQISFQVQIQDAEYFDESASQVVRALDRLSSEGADIQ